MRKATKRKAPARNRSRPVRVNTYFPAPQWVDIPEDAKLAALGFRPAIVASSGRQEYVDCWQALLAARDEAELVRLQALADDVRLTNIMTMGAAEATDLKTVWKGPVLQYDAADMARRIAEAGARHKNRTKGQPGKKVGRQLAYYCPDPSCGRPLRGAGSDRIVLCGGTFAKRHEPAVCIFDPSSLPDYRRDDLAALYAQGEGEDVAPFIGETPAGVSQSLLQQAKGGLRPAKPGPAVQALLNGATAPRKPDAFDELFDEIGL